MFSKINYKKIKEFLVENNIIHNDSTNEFFGISDPKLIMQKFLVSKTKHESYYKKCDKDCLCVKNGILYFCSTLPSIETLNKTFNTDFKLQENKDFIFINKIESIEQILNLIKELPFCENCVNKEYVKWNRSEKDIKEFIE